ncbi:hypothetical protein, partial [Elizabethkingia miricola]
NYYTIYLLITANRKTTKLKSLIFDEYYTEDDFNNIFNSNDKEDKLMIDNEISSINIISELILSELKEFNTTFLTAYINFSNTISIWKADTELYLSEKSLFRKGNFLGVELDSIYSYITNHTMQNEVTIFEFYNYENQKRIIEYLRSKKIKNPKDLLADINKIIFYTSLEFFEWYIEGSKKNSDLKNRYFILFDNYKELIKTYLDEKYIKK